MTALPPIWIISLERASERRVFVESTFAELGVGVEIFDAVDGQALTFDDLQSYSAWRALYQYGTGLTPGVLGCSLSHLRAYHRMLDEGLEAIAVFEDDVKPMPDAPQILASIDEFPPDWQVVTLHSLFDSARPEPINDRVIAEQYRVCTYQRTPFGTQAYVINRSGAERVLQVAYPVCLPPDELLFRKHPAGLVVYGIEPSAVVHEEFESEVRRTRAPIERSGSLIKPLQTTLRAAGAVRRRALRRWSGRV